MWRSRPLKTTGGLRPAKCWTAAVCGVILNLAIWFAIHTIFRETVPARGYGLSFDAPLPASADLASLTLAAAAVLAIFRFNSECYGRSPDLVRRELFSSASAFYDDARRGDRGECQ